MRMAQISKRFVVAVLTVCMMAVYLPHTTVFAEELPYGNSDFEEEVLQEYPTLTSNEVLHTGLSPEDYLTLTAVAGEEPPVVADTTYVGIMPLSTAAVRAPGYGTEVSPIWFQD